jgi:thiol-disulfide isomerase/thioredoxin
MKGRRLQMVRALDLFAVLAPALALAAADDAPASRSFGPPPGTRSDYAFETDPAGGERTITIFRLPGSGDGEAIVLAPPFTPLFFRKPGAGLPLPDDPLIASPLFGMIDARGLSPGAAWEEETVLPDMFPPKSVKVRHWTGEVEGSPATIRVRSRLAAPQEMGLLGRKLVLKAWERELILDRVDLRPLEVLTAMEIELAGWGGEEAGVPKNGSSSFKETAHRPLTKEECEALATEVALMKRVLAAISARRSGGGGALSLFLGKPKGPPPDPLAILEEYEKAHPKGLLAAAVEPLRAQARAAIEAGEAVRAAEEGRAKLIGSVAPDFTLEDLQGKKVSLSDLRGKTILLAFWGYGSKPCRTEAPYLSQWQEKFAGDGLVVLAVNAYDESRAVVEKFVKEKELKQRVVLMGGTVAREKYFVDAFPTSFLLDREGKIVDRDVGFSPTVKEKKIQGLLAKDAGSRK